MWSPASQAGAEDRPFSFEMRCRWNRAKLPAGREFGREFFRADLNHSSPRGRANSGHMAVMVINMLKTLKWSDLLILLISDTILININGEHFFTQS